MENLTFKAVIFNAVIMLGLMSCEQAAYNPVEDNSREHAGKQARETGMPGENSLDQVLLTDGSGYPGRPAPGTLFWGAAIGGNGDPVSRHEIPSGEVLSLRRTFWRWDQRTGAMIDAASDDLAHGRLPWVSVKPPGCPVGESRCATWDWAGMADGVYDAQIDEMLTALAALPGPVWLTVHHEPEGGGGGSSPDETVGGIQAHIDMNRRVRERINGLGFEDDIALSVILMSWTWDSRSGRNPDDWWETGIYDFLGIDHYRDDANGSLLENGEPTPVWPRIRTWAAARNVDVAAGEWGLRGADEVAGQRVLKWYEHAANSNSDGLGARVVALSAFDSGLNAPTGSWELEGGQLEMFWQLLGDPRTAHVNDPPAQVVQHPVSAVQAGTSLSAYPAANAVDGSTATRWSSWDGDWQNWSWIQLDLGASESLSELRLMMYKGDQRTYPIKIEAGNTPSSLTEVWSGDTDMTAGLQAFAFSPVTARYVRVALTGFNSANKETLSFYEAEVWGSNL